MTLSALRALANECPLPPDTEVTVSLDGELLSVEGFTDKTGDTLTLKAERWPAPSDSIE